MRISFDRGLMIAGADAKLIFGAWSDGIAWRWGGLWYVFRPPWNRPLFSERNGYLRIVFRVGGWRLTVRP